MNALQSHHQGADWVDKVDLSLYFEGNEKADDIASQGENYNHYLQTIFHITVYFKGTENCGV